MKSSPVTRRGCQEKTWACICLTPR